MKLAEYFFIVSLLLLTFALRIVGINFGQPTMERFPSLADRQAVPENIAIQPDEYQFVTMPLRMVLTNSLNPHYYINPPLPSYLTYLHILLTDSAKGLSHETRKDLSEREYAPFVLYLIARIHEVLSGLLVVAATYATARLLAGRYAAAVAGIFIAVSPLLVQYGHYAKNSSLATALAALSIWACFIALQNTRWRWHLLTLAGITVGAAAASRYNAAPAAIVLCLTGLILWYRNPDWQTAIKVFVAWLFFPLTFVLSIPAIIFSFEEFWYGLTYGFQHYIVGKDVTNVGTNGRFFLLQYLVDRVIGIPAALLAIFGIIITIPKVKFKANFLKQNSLPLYLLLLLSYLIPYFIVVVNPTNVFRSEALVIPILPQLALLVGIAAAWCEKHWPFSQLLLRPILLIVIILLPLVMSVQFDLLISQPDTREKAQTWIYEHLAPGTNITLLGGYNVAIDKSIYNVTSHYTEFIDFDELAKQGEDYVILSDAVFRNIAQTENVGGNPELVTMAQRYLNYVLKIPNRIAWIERPQLIGSDDPMYLATYFHQPAIYIYCLNEKSCAPFMSP